MHRAAVAAFTAIVVACLASPGIAHAEENPGDTFVRTIEEADDVLIGQARDVRPGASRMDASSRLRPSGSRR